MMTTMQEEEASVHLFFRLRSISTNTLSLPCSRYIQLLATLPLSIVVCVCVSVEAERSIIADAAAPHATVIELPASIVHVPAVDCVLIAQSAIGLLCSNFLQHNRTTAAAADRVCACLVSSCCVCFLFSPVRKSMIGSIHALHGRTDAVAHKRDKIPTVKIKSTILIFTLCATR